MRSVEKLILTVAIVRSRSVAGRFAFACGRFAFALLSLRFRFTVALLCQNRLAYKTGFTKSKTGYLINF
jgi:hypothetical protein